MTQTNGWRVWIQYYWCSCCLLQTIITATWVVESLIFSKGYTQDTPNGISFRKQSKVQLTPLATSPTFWHGNKTPSATNGVPGIAPNLKQICHTLPTERNLVTCHRLFFSLAVTCATKKLWQHTCWRIPFFFRHGLVSSCEASYGVPRMGLVRCVVCLDWILYFQDQHIQLQFGICVAGVPVRLGLCNRRSRENKQTSLHFDTCYQCACDHNICALSYSGCVWIGYLWYLHAPVRAASSHACEIWQNYCSSYIFIFYRKLERSESRL